MQSSGTPTAAKVIGTTRVGTSVLPMRYQQALQFSTSGAAGGVPVAANLVSHGLYITGVDSSPTLISLCRSRLPHQEWMVADMRTLALARTFNGVLAWDSFFHLKPEDQRRIFVVFKAHAALNGLLMFNSGPNYGQAIGSYRGDPLYHASLDPAEYQHLLTSFGFEVIAHEVEDPLAGGRTVWLARRSH